MGLLLSLIISYAGVHEALDCMNHMVSGMVPEGDPDFRDLRNYYTRLLNNHKPSTDNPGHDWTKESGQGYLCLTEDEDGKLKSAAVKYYDGQPNSTAILFSTKISSFGQETVDDTNLSNGDYRTERYTPTRTKTILTNTSDSISVGNRHKSRSPSDNVSDPRYSEGSFERDQRTPDTRTREDTAEKVTWHYRPKSPIIPTLPEINFQSYDDAPGVNISEEQLRSIDGIKYRPLQRSDPSGRRRSFKKRQSSSSSTSSRDSRASREEELRAFTSLEEAEFECSRNDLGSSNLVARSHSRSRSRESSKERRNDARNDPSVEQDDRSSAEPRPLLKDLTKLDSFEEEEKVKEDTADVDDFWGSSGD